MYQQVSFTPECVDDYRIWVARSNQGVTQRIKMSPQRNEYNNKSPAFKSTSALKCVYITGNGSSVTCSYN